MGRKKSVKNEERKDVRYQKIVDASRTTGLSQYFLRKGCIAGVVPHIMNGNRYMIDVPALYEVLSQKEA